MVNFCEAGETTIEDNEEKGSSGTVGDVTIEGRCEQVKIVLAGGSPSRQR